MDRLPMDLFDTNQNLSKFAPLADRMRPKILTEFLGQEDILGPGKPLRKMITSGQISSVIFWGPPGSGKTTLARIVASKTKAEFVQMSAVTSGVKDVRAVIAEAKDRLKFEQRKTILFVDEIHRFNKAQQDAFMPWVENGTVILIGATTENPGFEVNAPLISRSQVFMFSQLKDGDINTLINRALKKFYPKTKIEKPALNHIVKSANGDARTALNTLETATFMAQKITLPVAEEAAQQKAIYYDKKGDYHYDTISAFIKSLRGSDADAAVHYLARMIKAGEDPMFIARRLVIFASEDIGNAMPTALVVATGAMQATHMIGMPEASIILSQAATYLATCPKSRTVYDAISTALSDIDENRLEPIPLFLRNAPTGLAKDLGFGKGYQWTDDPAFHKKHEFLPKNLRDKRYYKDPRGDKK